MCIAFWAHFEWGFFLAFNRDEYILRFAPLVSILLAKPSWDLGFVAWIRGSAVSAHRILLSYACCLIPSLMFTPPVLHMSRPASPAHFWHDFPHILAGRDEMANGGPYCYPAGVCAQPQWDSSMPCFCSIPFHSYATSLRIRSTPGTWLGLSVKSGRIAFLTNLRAVSTFSISEQIFPAEAASTCPSGSWAHAHTLQNLTMLLSCTLYS